MFPNHTPLTAWLARWLVLIMPNTYSYCLFTVTVPDMKSRSAHAFMCVMVMVVVGVVVGVCVCVCVCVCAWSGWFLLQSPEMKLTFLLQFISQRKTFTSYVIGAEPWRGATSASANNVLCLLTFAWRWSRIAMTFSAGVPPPGCSKTSVRQYLISDIRQYLISDIRKTILIWYRILMHIWVII